MKNYKKPIVVVTGNKNKASEIGSIIVRPVEAINLDIPEIQSLDVEIVAKEKALTAYKLLSRPVLVDDTGMNIEALGGLPGALVSWFLDQLGPVGILKILKEEQNRKATVHTCIAYADNNGCNTFVGSVEGEIPFELKGEKGFGYDPIFIPKGFMKTYAEMSAEEKNAISMRNIALLKFKNFIESLVEEKYNFSEIENIASFDELRNKYDEIKELTPRTAAEIAYVIARIYLESGDENQAKSYFHESISLFDKCKMETMEDCATQFVSILGVSLPSIIHQDFVRKHLSSI